MSEERWAQQKEWAEEKRRGFDVEIKESSEAHHGEWEGEVCQARKCKATPTWLYVVGKVDQRGGMEILLCAEHADDETAFEIYNEI